MGTRIVYQVNELQAESAKLSSKLQTSDPFLAFSDFILKAKSPLENVNMSRSLRSLLRYSTYPCLPGFAQSGPINLGWSVTTKGIDTPVVITSLNTVLHDGKPDYLSPESHEKYRNTHYIKALQIVRDILKDLSVNDTDVCQLLACCALNDHRHFLWQVIFESV